MRAINFSAGPAHLPAKILQQAQSELLNWNNTGASVMEISHRSDEFMQLHSECKQSLRRLLNLPDNYDTIMMQGGARLQFAMLPMNILQPGQQANIIVNGFWSQLAAREASKLSDVNIINTKIDSSQISLRSEQEWQGEITGDYLHFTPNETIDGISMPCPKVKANIIADMSSCILSEPIEIKDYSLIYACAQKNLGPSGLTIVVIDKNLALNDSSKIPSYLSYQAHLDQDSMLNTPPTFQIYMTKLMLDWIEEQGGPQKISANNTKKAELLYSYIDNSKLYHNNIEQSCRSKMNIPFHLNQPEKNDLAFIEQAKAAGIIGIKGHKSAGGMRASIYNAMTIAQIERLIDFMDEFQSHNA
jgi:phosphoserine aminotransferase